MSANSIKRIDTKGRQPKRSTLCLDCDRIVGCPWMQLHRPVPGWTAVRTYIIESVDGSLRRGDAQVKLVPSYCVFQCPLFLDPEVKMQQKRLGITKYTSRGETTYRVRCSYCGYKPAIIFDTMERAEDTLDKTGWAFITGGALMCPACQQKRRKD